MLLGITGRMDEVSEVKVAMLEFGNIAWKIGCILHEVADESHMT